MADQTKPMRVVVHQVETPQPKEIRVLVEHTKAETPPRMIQVGAVLEKPVSPRWVHVRVLEVKNPD